MYLNRIGTSTVFAGAEGRLKVRVFIKSFNIIENYLYCYFILSVFYHDLKKIDVCYIQNF